MNEAGSTRDNKSEKRSVSVAKLGGSDTTPTWIISMPKVLKKNTPGEVVKIEMSATAAVVMPSSSHRGSEGQVAWAEESGKKLNDFGNVDVNSVEVNPFRVDVGNECAAPSSFTTPHPPPASVTTPACIAAWQTKLSAR
jgi:ribosomal protein L21E